MMDVVQEAEEWIGTPYVRGASLKGLGADCVGLILGVGKATGKIPSDYQPGPYEENDGEMLERELLKLCVPVPVACNPGDVLVLELPMARRHCAILTEPKEEGPVIVHVYGRKIGCTKHRMNDVWMRRVISAWRWRA